MISHCGSRIYCVMTVAGNTVHSKSTWNDLEKVVIEFLQYCLHFLITRTGEQSLDNAQQFLHDHKFDVFFMSYLYKNPEKIIDLKYLLVLKHFLTWHTCFLAEHISYSNVADASFAIWIEAFQSIE